MGVYDTEEIHFLRQKFVSEFQQIVSQFQEIEKESLRRNIGFQISPVLSKLFFQQNKLLKEIEKKIYLIQINLFESLPDEILYQIFTKVDILSLLNLPIVCKRFCNVSYGESLWKKVVCEWWVKSIYKQHYNMSIEKFIQIINGSKSLGFTWHFIVRWIAWISDYSIYDNNIVIGLDFTETEINGKRNKIPKIVIPKIDKRLINCIIFYDHNKDIYVGPIYEGKFNGKGILYRSNGHRYEGNFLNDSFHGDGIYAREGEWECKSKFVENVLDGETIYSWNDGYKFICQYEGTELNSSINIYIPTSDLYKQGILDENKIEGCLKCNDDIIAAKNHTVCLKRKYPFRFLNLLMILMCPDCNDAVWYCLACPDLCLNPSHTFNIILLNNPENCECQSTEDSF